MDRDYLEIKNKCNFHYFYINLQYVNHCSIQNVGIIVSQHKAKPRLLIMVFKNPLFQYPHFIDVILRLQYRYPGKLLIDRIDFQTIQSE